MASECVVCHKNDASLRCRQCHKWVCDSCAFKDDNGAFCGRECANKYRDFQKSQTSGTEKAGKSMISSLIKKVFVLLLLLLLAAALYVFGANRGWFGEQEQSRVESGTKILEEKIDKGSSKLDELKEKAEEKIGQ
jgi:uncharacterized membrane protein